MNAEILAVGTELLLGDIVNTNAQYLAKELAGLGISVYYQTVVGDNRERLKTALKSAFERADMVITTGGLGPTEDDLTKETGAEVFGKELTLDQESLDMIEDYFQAQSLQMTPNNKKQAYIPQGAVPLKNDHGTAPGVYLEEDGKILIMLPGPPREVEPMFKNRVLPLLKQKQEAVFVSKVMHICGVGESKTEDMVKDLIQNQQNPTIAPYAKYSEVTLRITASADTEEKALQLIEPVKKELYSRFGYYIYGEDDITLEEAVVQILKERGLTLAVAESCTGGMLSSRLVDCPGISDIFLEGIATYSNASKMARLGVKKETLEAHGAVSEETAREMAAGICETTGAKVGIAITGVAGPGGGTEEKPVGTVYIALNINGSFHVKKLYYRGSRERIRSRSVVAALNYLRLALLNA